MLWSSLFSETGEGKTAKPGIAAGMGDASSLDNVHLN